MKRIARRALCLHLLAVVIIAALAYGGALGDVHWLRARYVDKALHFVLVGMVAFWITKGWDDPRLVIAGRSLPLALALPFTLASAEEAFQALSPHRSADVRDWLANTSGLIAFWLLGRLRLPARLGHNV